MTSCHACADFARNPLTGSYFAGCLECKARSIANGRVYFEAKQAGQITDAYRKLLDKTFAGDWKLGREMVKKYAAARVKWLAKTEPANGPEGNR